MGATFSPIRSKLVYVFVLSILLASWAWGEEESEVAKTLSPIRAKLQSKALSYEEVAQMTAPLIQEYMDNSEALGQIYRLRADFARRGGTGQQELDELRVLLPLLPEDDLDARNKYEERFLYRARPADEPTFRTVYEGMKDRLENLAEYRPLLMRAHKHAGFFFSVWRRADDAMSAYKGMLETCDYASLAQVRMAYADLELFLRWRKQIAPPLQELYELADSIRPHLQSGLNRKYAALILRFMMEMEEELGKPGAMLKTADELIALDPDNVGTRLCKVKAYRAIGNYADAEALAREIILSAPDTSWAFEARIHLVESSLTQGNIDEALGRARIAFDVATTGEEVSRAIQLIARTMAARDGHLANANQFLLFQKCGRAGPDGEMGTQDDLPQFKDTIARVIDPAFRGQLIAEAEKEIDLLDATALQRRGMLYLHAGEPDEALETFQKQYLLVVSDVKLMPLIASFIAVVMRAASFQTFGATAFLEYQQYGPVGRDGQPGTQDDPAFRFPDRAPPPELLLDASEQEFHQELQGRWYAPAVFEKGFRYASALVLGGQYDEALSVTVGLYCAARDEETLTAASVGVAAALRARDKSFVNASRFLIYQQHGSRGPDDKLGTQDDLGNPLTGFQPALPATHLKWLASQANDLSQGGKYRHAAYAYLHMGDAGRALSALKRARGLCPFEADAINEMTRDILTAFKALNGHTFGADPVIAFMQYGPDGKDGRPGTADDLADPLAQF